VSRNVINLNIPRDAAQTEEYNNLVNALGAVGVLLHLEPAQTGDVITTADATDTTTRVALANILRTAYNAHIASTAKHGVADATNPTSAAAATNDATALTLINEIKADFNAHQALITGGVHRGKGGQGSTVSAPVAITTADGTDATTTGVLINAVKAAFNLHVQNGANNIVLIGP